MNSYDLKPTFYRGSTRTTASWGPIFTRQEHQQAAEFFKNLMIGDWPILCGRERAFQGPPRTSLHIAARQSSMAKKSF
jgi:hypothetical protein